jgi:flagellar L-ring protein precursor FlgH
MRGTAGKVLLGAFALGLAVTALPSRAESIWERRSERSAFLFRDNRARRVGDLVTVRIQERTIIDNDEKRQALKDTKLGGSWNFSGTLGKNSANGDLDSTTTSNRNFDGQSKLGSDREFTDDIAATVIDILPNGNLLIEGYRKRKVANECRTLRFSGVIRPDDIRLGNIVYSRDVANFQISYEGAGDESRFVNQGWGGKIVNGLWPF